MKRVLVSVIALTTGCTTLLGIDGEYRVDSSGSTSSSAATATSTSTSTGGVEPTCDDGETNGDETDVDCGGSCDPCERGARCGGPGDCVTLSCQSDVCACPAGAQPSGTSCVCAPGFLQCGEGPADACVKAVVGAAEVSLDSDATLWSAWSFGAHPGDDSDDPTHGILFTDATSTRLARLDQTGAVVEITPVGDVATRSAGLLPSWEPGYDAIFVEDGAPAHLTQVRVPYGAEPEEASSIAELATSSIVSSTASRAPGEGVVAFVDDGDLHVARLEGDLPILSTVELGGEVTALATAYATLGGQVGVGFVQDAALRFTRVAQEGGITEPQPLELGFDLDRGVHLAGFGGGWLLGGSRSAGGVGIVVLDANGAVAADLHVGADDARLGALTAVDGRVYAVWSESDSTRASFTRIAIDEAGAPAAEEPIALPRPNGGGTFTIVGSARAAGPGVPGLAEVAVLSRLEGSIGDDGIYLTRLGTCEGP